MQTEILVVDDEQEIADLVELYLGNETGLRRTQILQRTGSAGVGP